MRSLQWIGRHVSRYERGVLAARLAGVYVLIVSAATVYVVISTCLPGSQGLEALVLLAVTSPLSQLLIFLPMGSLNVTVQVLLWPAAGLVQAWLLWLIARGRRKSAAPPPEARSPE
ncbi:hypothetical protein Sru01_67180 [Sphaerisporangium rufum]|uniref:Uncharacterized protein n=1 Tax=Sphaerisporangium rufum TaxID=1381558 RepID=A0A919RB39_9ACTN|nr:hypothetical protein [Sphaerisporangium rufum]GII81736.1 hypothetical protein Sru01_67180 [Sphaerisporangium rufum]